MAVCAGGVYDPRARHERFSHDKRVCVIVVIGDAFCFDVNNILVADFWDWTHVRKKKQDMIAHLNIHPLIFRAAPLRSELSEKLKNSSTPEFAFESIFNWRRKSKMTRAWSR